MELLRPLPLCRCNVPRLKRMFFTHAHYDGRKKMRVCSAWRFSVTSLALLTAIAMPVNTTVTTIGKVNPGDAAVQPDPWAVGNRLYVGKSAASILNVEAGGVVSNTKGFIGYEADSNGTVTVIGANSIWDNSGYLYVGRYGEGTVTIENGGRVENTNGYIGIYADAVGTVTVTGTGST